jgi:hypothetical protein
MSAPLSPGRSRAMELSGNKIQADTQHAAPDGHPVGPGVNGLAVGVAAEDMQATSPAKSIKNRPMPFGARKP